jgi:hypothetical protein
VSSRTLDELDQPMDTKLWITPHDQMNVIGHDFYLHKLLLPSLNTFLNENFESNINRWKQDLSPVLWTKDDMVVTVIGDIFVTFNYCSHAQSIAENSSSFKCKLLVVLPYYHPPSRPSTPLQKGAPYIPKALGQGFYGACDKRHQ